MVELKRAEIPDMEMLITTQIRTFKDDNKRKPPDCSMEGPPGYNSVKWNSHWIENTPYYKILCHGQIIGGLILFDMDEDHFEVGRIWIDPDFQNQGFGQAAMKTLFNLHPDVKKWTLGTPSWAIRNQYFYEKMGFMRLRETAIEPKLGWSAIEYELIFGKEN